jgi:hypothetical protein
MEVRMSAREIGTESIPLVTGDFHTLLEGSDTSQPTPKEGMEFFSEITEGLGCTLKTTENLMSLGSWVCLMHSGPSAISGVFDTVASDLSRVQNTVDIVDFIGMVRNGELSDDTHLKNMEVAEGVFTGAALAFEPIFYLQDLGLYTLGVAAEAMGKIQTGLFLGCDIIGFTSASYELSVILEEEKYTQESLRELNAVLRSPEIETNISKAQWKLQQIHELVIQKMLNLIRKIFDVFASVLGIVALSTLPMVIIPVVALLNIISCMIGFYSLWCSSSAPEVLLE